MGTVKEIDPQLQELEGPLQWRLWQAFQRWVALDACPETHDGSHTSAIETVVVGVSYTGRQGAIAFLMQGDEVWLLREPDNRFDRNAVRVMRRNGRQVGYLNRHLARELAPRLDDFCLPVPAKVTSLTGEAPMRGVRIRFVVPRA
jgi:hypothetical protein